MVFRNRQEAGRRLAQALAGYRHADAVVLGLPRGGVPVAHEVARALGAPLDVIVVRKVGVPLQPEVALAAVGEDGVLVVNEDVRQAIGISGPELTALARPKAAEVEERVRRLRGGRPRTPLEGRVAIIVDDGIATGATARAACRVARAQGARTVVLAVPVSSARTVAELRDAADAVVCVETPPGFRSVGEAYADFGQVSEGEVAELLARARAGPSQPKTRSSRSAFHSDSAYSSARSECTVMPPPVPRT